MLPTQNTHIPTRRHKVRWEHALSELSVAKIWREKQSWAGWILLIYLSLLQVRVKIHWLLHFFQLSHLIFATLQHSGYCPQHDRENDLKTFNTFLFTYLTPMFDVNIVLPVLSDMDVYVRLMFAVETLRSSLQSKLWTPKVTFWLIFVQFYEE